MSTRTALETFVWLIEEAFDGDPDHSLIANLRNLGEQDWTSLPAGAARSIAEILEHVGWSKWIYEDYAFGSASLRGDQPPLVPANGELARPQKELLEWLTEGHNHWLYSVRNLADDSELDRPRLTN
jgi:hypothetical protein